ncbi:MAG: SulP family inorganic anion transporter [Flavobacteriaceae bacterium]
MFQFVDTSIRANFRNDILSGLTVALALVPEAVAFAFVAGVSPIAVICAFFCNCSYFCYFIS